MPKSSRLPEWQPVSRWRGRGAVRLAAYAVLALAHVLLAARFLTDRSPGTAAAWTGFPLDDAWIHLVYGRELAWHGLPYYNTGTLEAGFSSPLWLLGTGFAELLHRAAALSPVLTLKVLGVLCALGATLLVFELSLAATASPGASLVAALLSGASPGFAFSQVSGMEVCLAAAVALAALLAWVRGRLLAAGVLSGLAYLARPELAVVAPLLAALFLRGEGRKDPWPGLARLALPAAAAAALWAAYCLAATGHPLPNTFYAKYGGGGVGENLGNIVRTVVLGAPLAFGYPGLVLYAVGVRVLLQTRRRLFLPVLALPWGFVIATAATRRMPVISGEYYYWLRYALPGLPALFVPVAAGVAALWRRELPELRRLAGGSRAAGPVLAAALLAACVYGVPGEVAKRGKAFAWNCQNIDEVQVAFGRWVRAYVPETDAVAVNDAGAIRYFGERRTVDLLGLNNADALFRRRSAYREDFQNPRLAAGFLRELGAPWLIAFPSWFGDLVSHPGFGRFFEPVASFESRNYTIAPAAQDVMVAWRLRE